MSELIFKIPGRQAKGYLKLQRTALEFADALRRQPTVETLDNLVDFLAQFIDAENPAELIWECSEEQFDELLNAIIAPAPTDPKVEERSETGFEETPE